MLRHEERFVHAVDGLHVVNILVDSIGSWSFIDGFEGELYALEFGSIRCGIT